MMKKRLFLLLLAALLMPFGMKAQHNVSVHVDSTIHACDSYTWSVNGETYTESGVHTAIVGDTLYILDLTLDHHISVLVPETIHGGCTYTWGDSILSESGSHTQTFTATNGCDSTVTINLSISGTAIKGYTVTACESYTWKGIEFTQSTDTTLVISSDPEASVHCDSILNLSLTIIEPEQKTYDTVVVACERARFRFSPSQQWTNVTQDGYVLTSTAYGNTTQGRSIMHPRTIQKCYDSLVTVTFNIRKNKTYRIPVEDCDSYTFEIKDTAYTYYFSTVDTIRYGRASNGCDSLIILNVTINKTPEIKISGDLRVAYNQTATLTAHCDQNVNYSWNVSSSHDSTITTAPLTTNTDITVTGTNNSTHCQGSSSVTVVVMTVGIDGTESEMLRIFPNPTASLVNINSESTVSNISVFNVAGQQVMNVKGSNTVDMRSLENGNYVLRIEFENGNVATSTVVLKK